MLVDSNYTKEELVPASLIRSLLSGLLSLKAHTLPTCLTPPSTHGMHWTYRAESERLVKPCDSNLIQNFLDVWPVILATALSWRNSRNTFPGFQRLAGRDEWFVSTIYLFTAHRSTRRNQIRLSGPQHWGSLHRLKSVVATLRTSENKIYLGLGHIVMTETRALSR